ncbi:hypothetical protein D3C80_1619610 [compost metagenome]
MLPDPLDQLLRHAVPEEQQRQRLIERRLRAPGHTGLGVGPLRHPDPAAAAGLHPARQPVVVGMVMGHYDLPDMIPG